jgi:outer membrane protein assembly factor BamE
MPRFFSHLILLALCLFCVACSSANQVAAYIKPYRIDVRQGNWVTQEMVSQLRPGQTRDQVRFILGSPLLTDMFHADRWDYVYRFQPGRGDAEQRRLVLYFQDDKLVRVGGDVVADDGRHQAAESTNKVIDLGQPEAKPTDKAQEKVQVKPQEAAQEKSPAADKASSPSKKP